MAHDPLGASWGLTPRGYAAAASLAASWGVPLLVLGGGGYDDAAAARAWTAVLAALQGRVRWESGAVAVHLPCLLIPPGPSWGAGEVGKWGCSSLKVLVWCHMP